MHKSCHLSCRTYRKSCRTCRSLSNSLVPTLRFLVRACTSRARNTKLVQVITIASSSIMLELARHVTSRHDTTSYVICRAEWNLGHGNVTVSGVYCWFRLSMRHSAACVGVYERGVSSYTRVFPIRLILVKTYARAHIRRPAL